MPERLREEVNMAYRFQVNEQTCINCGICMDLCPVRCLDMTRPSGAGERGGERERQSPIPGMWGGRGGVMLGSNQGATCIWGQGRAQEGPNNAITLGRPWEPAGYGPGRPGSH